MRRVVHLRNPSSLRNTCHPKTEFDAPREPNDYSNGVVTCSLSTPTINTSCKPRATLTLGAPPSQRESHTLQGYTGAKGVRCKTCGTVRSEEALHRYDPRVACPASHEDDDTDAVGHSFNCLFPS